MNIPVNPDFPACRHDSVTDGSCNRCGVPMKVLLDLIERQREAIKSALMFIYDSEQGIDGVEESANKTIDTLEATLSQGEAGGGI